MRKIMESAPAGKTKKKMPKGGIAPSDDMVNKFKLMKKSGKK